MGIGPNVEDPSSPAELTACRDDTCGFVSDPHQELQKLLHFNRLMEMEFTTAREHSLWR